MTQRDRDMIFDAGAWDRRLLGGTALLSEGRVFPEDEPALLQEARALFEAGLRGAPRPLDEPHPSNHLGITDESGAGSDHAHDEFPLGDLHARLAAAILGQPYVAVPERVSTKLLEARHTDPELPLEVYARLAAAIQGRPYVPVSETADTKLLEVLGADPELPAGIHERLANAILGRTP